MIADKPINGLYSTKTNETMEFFASLSKPHGGPFSVTHTVNPLSTETQPDAELSFKSDEGLELNFTLDRPLTPIEIAILTGMKIVVVPKWIIAEAIYVEAARKHKKKRIAKKWLKRYGLKATFGPERSFIKDDTLYVGPDTYKGIKEKIK